MTAIGESDWPRAPRSHLNPQGIPGMRPCGDREGREMSAQSADARQAERGPGFGTGRVGPFLEGPPLSRARGDPLRDPGGGLHHGFRDEQGTPRTESRVRRSAFRGNDGTPGRDRVSRCFRAVLNDGCRACGAVLNPGSSAAVLGARPAISRMRTPDVARKDRWTPKRPGRSIGCAARREGRTRFPRTRIAPDNSRYHEQDCQAAFFRVLASTTPN